MANHLINTAKLILRLVSRFDRSSGRLKFCTQDFVIESLHSATELTAFVLQFLASREQGQLSQWVSWITSSRAFI